jgi:hypothetical protein
MKPFIICGIICLGALTVPAQQSEIESLKRQLQEQQKTIESLMKKMDALEQRQASTNQVAPPGVTAAITNAPPGEISPDATTSWSPRDPLRLLSYKQSYIDISFDGLFSAGSSTAEDVEELQLGGHDPKQRGFTVQNLETTFEGKVDPYFRGQANIVLAIDPDGETIIEAEEAYLETLALPWNLQIKAGQYFTEFGRLNPTHPHSWAFVDQPLVNGRFFGADGLRNPGARLGWLMPTPFYSELLFSIQNSHGETATSFRSEGGHGHGGEEDGEELPFALRHPDNDRGLRNIDDLLFVPRWVTSFDLTDSQTALLGASAAFGPNRSGEEGGGDTRTQIYGLDFMWKWKSPSHSGGFPFVQWQTEAMLRRYKAGAFDWDEDGDGAVSEGELEDLRTGTPAVFQSETLTDYGVYSQLVYGFRKGWVAGLRFDHVWGERGDYEEFAKSFNGGAAFTRDPMREARWRLSPNLTWYPTEFSKLRLQYNYDDRRTLGVDHSVWLQFEFLLGAHAAHKF